MFFPYRFDHKFAGLWWPLGVRDGKDGVTVTDESFIATFGRFRVETPMSNVVEAHVTLDYDWWKAVGIRLSFADDGLTFGTATHGGVCVHFDQNIPRVAGFKTHSAITVTVQDLDGLAQAINDAQGATAD